MNYRAMNLHTTQMVRNSDALDTASALLRDLIDYAGLFPPASLAMAPSVANYDAYSRSEWSWILGRFIVPVARLSEFEEAFIGLPAPAPGIRFTNWRVSVLLSADVAADVVGIREFNARMAGSSSGRGPVVESVEVKVASSEEVKRLSGIIPAEAAWEQRWLKTCNAAATKPRQRFSAAFRSARRGDAVALRQAGQPMSSRSVL